MKYTNKLGLPIWNKPETDVFDIEQFNEGMQAIDDIVINILKQINDLVIGDTQIDLNGYVKEEVLKEYAKRTELSNFLTQTDLLNYLDKTYLDRLATKDELSSYAKTDDLSNYALTSSLSNYALKNSLFDYATITQLQTTNNNINNLIDRINTLESSGGGTGDSSGGGTGLTVEQANNIKKIPSIEATVASNSQAIANKADKNHEHTEYLKEIPDEYVTDTELSSKGYATETFVTNKIAEASLSGGDVDLSGYATKDDIPTKISELTNDSGFITSIPSEYITETELNAKKYLTSVPSTYALKTDIPTVPTKTSQLTNDSNFITSIPEEYITETELNAKGYLTKHQDISNLALKSEIPNTTSFATDLSLTGSKLQLKNSSGALIGKPITLPTSSGGGTTEITTVNNGLSFVNPFYGKILNVLGDSQTASNYHKTKIYHDWVKELIGFSTVNNYGYDGATITNISTSHYKYLSEVYSNMSNDADLIIVMAGINELIQKTTIGNPTDTSNTTLYGALKVLFKGLRQKYPGKPIMFITPTHSNNPAVLNGETSCGKNLKEVVEIIIDICKLYSIPVFDAYSLTGIDPSVYAGTVNTDLLHLNNSGQEILGKMVSNFIIQNFFTMKYTQTSTPESNKTYGNIILSATSLNVNESATTSFTVKLDKAPTDNQTVTLNVNNSNCSLNKKSLTFTPDNYGSTQAVEVTGSHASTDYTNKTSVITATSSNVSSKTINVTINNIDVEKTLSSISATYNQGSTKVYPSTSLNTLKNNLVVTAKYSDSSTATVTNYSLSGTLSVGTSEITVTYNGKTATFNVTVSEEQQEEPTGWANRKVTYAYAGGKYFCIGFKNNPSFANGTISVNLSATINSGSFTTSNGGGVFSAENDTMNNNGYKGEIGKIGTVTWTTEGTSLTMTASPTFKASVSDYPYCKIAFPVKIGAAASSFTINSIELKVNGNAVDITNIGGFFSTDGVTVSGATTTTSVTGVTLSSHALTIDKIGGTQTLRYTITPSDATNKNVTWSTSVPTVASVNNGLVTANANGTTVITIKTTDGGHTDTCTVTVNDPSYVEGGGDDTLYVPDIASYGISKDGTNSEATTNGLNRLFADLNKNKKTNVQLPTGTYAINPDISLTPKSNLTLDLNNSKLKIDTNGKNGSTMIYLKEVENLTLKNATIEGDR